MTIERRIKKGTILQRADYSYDGENQLRKTTYEYKNSGFVLGLLGANGDGEYLKYANPPLDQNTLIDEIVQKRFVNATEVSEFIKEMLQINEPSKTKGQRKYDILYQKSLEDLATIVLPKAVFIKRLRKSLGLTQKAFGKICGVSNVTVYMWEHGQRKPSKTAELLMKKLKVGND